MVKRLSTGVPYFEHPRETDPADLNWESVRVFLRLIQTGSFRSAARRLGVSTNTVRSQIDLLERQIGTPLVTRGVSGIEATNDGLVVYESALRMERASFDLRREQPQHAIGVSGPVRISVTEGIGTFWITPQATKFQRANPKLIVELNCTMRPSDPIRLESDIGIQISEPTNPDLKAVRLGRMHAMPYAAPEYLDTYGRPRSMEDIKRHRIVEQLSPQLYNDQVDVLFPDVPREGFIAVRTNTSTAHYWAVAGGAGLGMLPTYLSALGARVVPLEDIPLRTQFDIWMTYHPDTGKAPRMVATRNWLRQVFSQKHHPWFRDEFIPPSQFSEVAGSFPIRRSFDVLPGI